MPPIIEATRSEFEQVDGEDIFAKAKVTADSGFHSKTVLAEVEKTGADAYIADRDYRRRDPAFASAERHKQRDRRDRARKRRREREARGPAKKRLFTLQDFSYDENRALLVCPAGHRCYKSGNHMLFMGYRVAHFKAPKTACGSCSLRAQCLRNPDKTPQRQITIIKGREGPRPSSRATRNAPSERMRFKFDTPFGRALYSKRMGTVEPVFANLQNKGMRRFTLRGQCKVNAQWQLFTLVHNIEKIAGGCRA